MVWHSTPDSGWSLFISLFIAVKSGVSQADELLKRIAYDLKPLEVDLFDTIATCSSFTWIHWRNPYWFFLSDRQHSAQQVTTLSCLFSLDTLTADQSNRTQKWKYKQNRQCSSPLTTRKCSTGAVCSTVVAQVLWSVQWLRNRPCPHFSLNECLYT